MTDDDLRALVANPPPGWFKLTVRLETADGATWKQTQVLISEGELRDRPVEELASAYTVPAILAVRDAVLTPPRE